MKLKVQKILSIILTIMGFISCGTSGGMSSKDASVWISAYTPEHISRNSVVCIEITDTLSRELDTLKNIDKIFKFKPSIKGRTEYNKKYQRINFIPNEGALKQGQHYKCSVNMAALTGIDTLKNFNFSFYVEKQEVKFSDIKLAVSQSDINKVNIEGKILFSHDPGELSLNNKLLSCGDNEVKINISNTNDNLCHQFKIEGVERRENDYSLKIKYGILEGFSETENIVQIPGFSKFKLISAKRVESSEPYINLEFSEPISLEQDLEGLITIENIDNIRIEKNNSNVKVYYPETGLENLQLKVYNVIKSSKGHILEEDIEYEFKHNPIPPAIEVPISGTILPDKNNLTFPFRAVNLAAVDVEVVKIYTNNIMTFLQESELNDCYRLRRVGRLIHKETIRLDKDPKLNLHKWQNFSIDLKNLFYKERGAIYNIRLTFCKDYSLYNKTKIDNVSLSSGITPDDIKTWDIDRPYISRNAPDYDWYKYSWRDDENPASDSYYMVTKYMPQYNLIASNLGLIVKRAEDNFIWTSVTDIMTTLPLNGIRVEAYNYQMQKIGTAYTNEQGFADFKLKGIPFIVTATDGISTTYLKVNNGNELSLSQFDVGGIKNHKGIKTFIYGERGVWRPGDDIHLTIIVDEKENKLPKNHPITLELYTPMERLYKSVTKTESVGNIYTFKISTSEDSPTGQWNAKFKVGGQIINYPVKIETIKPNRLKIKINSPEILRAGKVSKIGMESQWLNGIVADNLRANLEMSLYLNSQPFSQYKNYKFINPLYTYLSSRHNVFSCKLDSLGKASKNYILPRVDKVPGILHANLVAKVLEPGGDMSIKSKTLKYSPYKSYVGIALNSNEYETDKDLSFPVVCVNENGQLVKCDLEYKIYRLDWSWWMEGTADELERYVQSSSTEVVASGDIYTSNGHAVIPFRVDYPSYGKFLVYVKDKKGGHATGGTVYVDWPDWRGHSGKSNPDYATMLSFSLDKRKYKVGDNAIVYLPKLSGGKVLLSVENGSKVISRKWVKTSPTKETMHCIPITKEMTPNFYVHATLLQPHAQTLNDLPIRMYGVEGASVVDERTILHPIITVPDIVEPQQEFTIKVKEADSKPMNYTLAIVDEGLLDITSYRTPQPWSEMNKREALGVKTWDIYDDIIEAYAGEFTSILSIGGDEGFRKSEGKDKRFNPIVKFMGPFTLNKGTKTHKIKLPMYVGSVRVMVVAAKSGNYGSADKTVTVRSPLMILPSLPRVLTCGDKVKMPINVFVSESNINKVNVTVSVDGPLTIIDKSTKTLTFNHPSEQLTEYELLCDKAKTGMAKMNITASCGDKTVTETINIEVRNPLPDVVTSKTISLIEGNKHSFDWSDDLVENVNLSIATIPTIDFAGSFCFVENYKHLCSEQLSSRAMYILYARKFLNEKDKKTAEKLLPNILSEIYLRQLHNGGFAYWPHNTIADDWVTSMVGEVMIEAQRQGYNVPKAVYDNWKKYQYQSSRNYNHNKANTSDILQAYRLYTLALSGEEPIGSMNRLREEKVLSNQALLRLIATYHLLGRENVAKKLYERYNDAPFGNDCNTKYSSPLRDKAMALESMLLIGDNTQVFQLANEIAKEFTVSSCNTQEIGFVSVAMSRLSGWYKGKNNSIILKEPDMNPKIINGIDGVENYSLNPKMNSVCIENNGDEEIHVTLTTISKSRIDDKIKAVENGTSVNIEYLNLQNEKININNLNQGDEFIARISIRNKQPSSSMALSFVIPSGWEIWNERLIDSVNKDKVSNVDIRDDRVNLYFSIDRNELVSFKVRLRAAYKGTFILPQIVCEDMYKTNCRAVTENGRIVSVK